MDLLYKVSILRFYMKRSIVSILSYPTLHLLIWFKLVQQVFTCLCRSTLRAPHPTVIISISLFNFSLCAFLLCVCPLAIVLLMHSVCS